MTASAPGVSLVPSLWATKGQSRRVDDANMVCEMSEEPLLVKALRAKCVRWRMWVSRDRGGTSRALKPTVKSAADHILPLPTLLAKKTTAEYFLGIELLVWRIVRIKYSIPCGLVCR